MFGGKHAVDRTFKTLENHGLKWNLLWGKDWEKFILRYEYLFKLSQLWVTIITTVQNVFMVPIGIGYLPVVLCPKPPISYSDCWCWAGKFPKLMPAGFMFDSPHGGQIWERKRRRGLRETPSCLDSCYHASVEGMALARLSTYQEAGS